ncbi:hypothetical protein M0804_009434 [Polistes exclamans]|nr:hypothetical protein M0804_009434 [Polistes exclamans]
MLQNGDSTMTFKLLSRRRTTYFNLSDIISVNNLNPIRKTRENVNDAIVLQRMSNGYRIGFNNFDHVNAIRSTIQDGFFEEEPMCEATDLLNDIKSLKTSLKIIYKKLLDTQSCCAVKEGENKIVGVAIASINLMGDHPHQGDAIFNIMSIKSCVFSKARPYERLEIEKFFRIHLLYVNKNNRKKGIGTALTSCCIDLARNLLAPACIGGFSSTITQIIARKLGFTLLAEVKYKDFQIFNDESESFETPFKNVINGNNSLACMALPIKLSTLPLRQLTPEIFNNKEQTSRIKSKRK